MPCRGKKIKTSGVRFFLLAGDILLVLVVFGQKKTTDSGKIITVFSARRSGGKNKIKRKCQFFFLVGSNFISPEDLSPIEYCIT